MKKASIIFAYTLIFWIALPALLIVGSLSLDRHLHLQSTLSLIPLIAGVALAVFSSVMLVVSIIQFVRFSKVLPISALPPDSIIQCGIYALVRHPVYLFYTLLWVGVGIAISSTSMLVIVLPVFVGFEFFYVLIEEAVLVRRHGDAYRHYRGRTGLFIPRFYHWLRIPAYILCKTIFSYRVFHKERIPRDPRFFIAATHRNYLDPFIIATAVSFPIYYVTTFEVFRSFLSRLFFRKLFCVPRKRYLNDMAATRQTLRLLKEGAVIGLFPEGERSWTGVTLPFKPEVIKLLKKNGAIPIVPIRLEGNFHAWPRWGKGIRRAPVTVCIEEPLQLDPEWNLEQIERELRKRIVPHDDHALCRSRNRVRDIGIVVYRCPVCMALSRLVPVDGRQMKCADCSTYFELTPRYEIAYLYDGQENIFPIDELYQKIRIKEVDIVPTMDKHGEASGAPSENRHVIFSCNDATCSLENRLRFVKHCAGSLYLTNRSIICSADTSDTALEMPLSSIWSVTIESNSRLQVYDGRKSSLCQFTFANTSALLWQDYIVEAVSFFCGTRPNAC